MEDEERESEEDGVDTPRQQICKKRWRGYLSCVLCYFSVGLLIFWKLYVTDTAATYLEQVRVIVGNFILVGVNLGK